MPSLRLRHRCIGNSKPVLSVTIVCDSTPITLVTTGDHYPSRCATYRMDIAGQLLSLNWPDAFVVRYRDRTSERLLRNDGVHVTPAADDPDGHGGFIADLPKKHPRNQKQCGRYVSFADLLAIRDENGDVLWRHP